MSADSLIHALQGLGDWALPLCLAIMTVSAILPIPAELPALVNGAVLGMWQGALVTWLGAMMGAVVSYRASGWLLARFGPRLMSTRARDRLSSLGASTSPGELVLLRLTPVVAFHLINYLAGAARVPWTRFIWTTAVGILPGCVAFTAAGSAMAHWMANPLVKWGAVGLVVGLVGWRVWLRGRMGSGELRR